MVGEQSPSLGRLGMLIALTGVLVGAGLGLTQRQAPMSSPLPPPATVVVAGPSLIEVHVAGWVVSPGVVAVPEGSLTADAIRAAGGLRVGARADAVNLAAVVAAGQQLVVPGPGGVEMPSAGLDAGSQGGLLSINRATSAEFETLPGVGPVLAGRIAAFREQHGPFREIEDLLGVPGIGEAKLAAIRDLITVP